MTIVGALDGLRVAAAQHADLDGLDRVFPELGGYYRARSTTHGLVLVARVGHRPVGAVFVSLEPPGEPELIRRLGSVPMLHKLMVDEQWRDRSVGTRLIGAAGRGLRTLGRRRMAVGVDLSNHGAARLYLRLGFQEWAYGLLDTIREQVDDAGKVVVVPDVCRIFVKTL